MSVSTSKNAQLYKKIKQKKHSGANCHPMTKRSTGEPQQKKTQWGVLSPYDKTPHRWTTVGRKRSWGLK